MHIAGHGVEALTFLRKTKFWRGQATIGLDLAAVLMDVEMPGKPSQLHGYPKVPIVLM